MQKNWLQSSFMRFWSKTISLDTQRLKKPWLKKKNRKCTSHLQTIVSEGDSIPSVVRRLVLLIDKQNLILCERSTPFVGVNMYYGEFTSWWKQVIHSAWSKWKLPPEKTLVAGTLPQIKTKRCKNKIPKGGEGDYVITCTVFKSKLQTTLAGTILSVLAGTLLTATKVPVSLSTCPPRRPTHFYIIENKNKVKLYLALEKFIAFYPCTGFGKYCKKWRKFCDWNVQIPWKTM